MCVIKAIRGVLMVPVVLCCEYVDTPKDPRRA